MNTSGFKALFSDLYFEMQTLALAFLAIAVLSANVIFLVKGIIFFKDIPVVTLLCAIVILLVSLNWDIREMSKRWTVFMTMLVWAFGGIETVSYLTIQSIEIWLLLSLFSSILFLFAIYQWSE